ncbi:ABC transporter permease subunit [Pseudothermotoga thermarum]|uniref:Monosaccharide ABC transporter membrane protein, CUT2 family n=1 Tax=Pseudothermotoga thermarum DSM 5069 TaxID=688269 RepID=F7YWH0_9THEM|nr:ABC transporter [Pseudothermotoga thermarum]AEH51949.1 monosaccharide ABC transporter membrane protein, CUT2 family [Pseudothermotoga thermarum DSM 5069]
MEKVKRILINYSVPIAFLVLSISAVVIAKIPWTFLAAEVVRRLSRNTFLVLSLIIPIVAGMGLNFGIVLGAMAGQAAMFFVVDRKISGVPGILLSMIFATGIAIVLGWLAGLVLNKARGREMITSMILGFFANGVYQLIFLFFAGSLIPFSTKAMLLTGGVGLRNTVDLWGTLAGALNSVWVIRIGMIRIFVVPLLIVAALCVFITLLFKTKLGQDIRAVGQDIHVAEVAGINVNKVRIIAVIMSTVLAAIGQIIYLQDIGTINTYNSHEQVALFSIATLLVGGASTMKASIWNAIIGVLLFHTLFVVAPSAGNKLFGQPQVGEFFREFLAYAVIAFALAMHGWKLRQMRKA